MNIPTILKNTLKSIVPRQYLEALNCLVDRYAVKSYSQEGEDLILGQIFYQTPTGFYVDVGAHHPTRFSNTYFFYKKGWHGINIDAMPGSMALFKKVRPRDINLEIPVSDKNETLTFYGFNDAALNTFSHDLALQRNNHKQYKIIFEKKLVAKPLSHILEHYMPADTNIDLLSVDVEGLELHILQSNNWNKYRPKVVVVESLSFSIDNAYSSPAYSFLANKSYRLVARTLNNLIFTHQDFQLCLPEAS